MTIIPANAGDACWEIEGDQTRESAPIQLWSRTGEKVHWRLVPIDEISDANEFYIYNTALARYVTSGAKIHDRVTSSATRGPAQRFHILRTEDGKCERCFAFIPVQHTNSAIICEDGNLGNSTKLVQGPIKTTHPIWALWKVTAV